MRILRYILGSLLVLSLFALPACDDSGDSTTDTGGTVDTGTDNGGGSDTPTEAECTGRCLTPLPSAGTNPRLLLKSIEYDTGEDVVGIWNVSGAAIDLNGWQLCHEQTCAAIPGDNSLPQSGNMTIHLNASGTNSATDVYISSFAELTRVGEIAIYDSSNFDSAASLIGYVRWGSVAGSGSRISVAVSDGDWESTTAYVPNCAAEVGLVAVGDVTLPRWWHSSEANCF